LFGAGGANVEEKAPIWGEICERYGLHMKRTSYWHKNYNIMDSYIKYQMWRNGMPKKPTRSWWEAFGMSTLMIEQDTMRKEIFSRNRKPGMWLLKARISEKMSDRDVQCIAGKLKL